MLGSCQWNFGQSLLEQMRWLGKCFSFKLIHVDASDAPAADDSETVLVSRAETLSIHSSELHRTLWSITYRSKPRGQAAGQPIISKPTAAVISVINRPFRRF